MNNKKIVPLGETLVCRCEEITKQEVIDAISEGYTTVNDIRKRTRAGMGFCQGKTCGRVIQQLINEYSDKNAEEILPANNRPPVRPIKAIIFAKGYDQINE